MLDGLIGRGGFSSKCKSLIKPTKTRIEVLRRRAEAKQRFLKEDLFKLLSNGLDINAYGRTEEFIAGQNLLSCYNFLEQACEYIYKQLSVLQKLRECPEECREPVASLMFAAARFSDLPELRDLRDVFQDRYGNSLECFANQVFAEKLASKSPTMEKRIQLLQDITSEYSIKWDAKAFQQRMANPSVHEQDKSIKRGSSAVTDGKYKLPNSTNAASQADKLSVRSKERIDYASRGPTLDNVKEKTVNRKEESSIPFVGKQEITGRTPRPATVKVETSLKGENHEILFRGRPDFIAEKHGSSRANDGNALKMETSGSSSSSTRPEYFGNHMLNADQKRENVKISSHARLRAETNGKSAYNDTLSQRKVGKSTDNVQEEGTDKLKSTYNSALPPPYVKLKDNPVPPPYVKPNENGNGAHHRSRHSRLDADGSSMDPSPRIQTNLAVSSDRVSKVPDPTYFREDGPEKAHDYRSQGRHKGSKHADFGSNGSSMDPPPLIQTKQAESSGRAKSPDHTHFKCDGREKDRDYRSNGGQKGSKYAGFGSDVSSMDPSPRVHAKRDMISNRVPKSPDHTYFKEVGPEKDRNHGGRKGSKHAVFGSDGPSMDPSLRIRDQSQKEADNSDKEEYIHAGYHIDKNNIPLPKPRSIRRKHSKSSSSHEDVGYSEDARVVKRTSSSKKKDKKGLQILFDDDHYKKDDEEKMMDKLLLHYSKKTSTYDIEKLRKKPQSSDGMSSQTRRREGPPETPELVIPPNRSRSLPPEQSGESAVTQKVFTRANSFQPDNQAKHVHPKLPDYDDLAARFAALKGR